jgi:hypothetical protein
MATYTAFAGALRPGMPGSFDGETYYYPVYADVIVLDENDVVLSVADQGNDWTGLLTLSSTEPFEGTDDLSDLRRKVISNLRPQFPQITEDDDLKVVWLDQDSSAA